MTKWYLSTLSKRPAMITTKTALDVEDYEEAKAAARQWAKDNDSCASIHCAYGYAYYFIDSAGHGWDRNTGAGRVEF